MPENWLRRLFGRSARGGEAGFKPRRFRPQLESLEERCVPALAVTDLTGGLTPTALVQNLVGAGVTISNVTYKGTNKSSGEFSGGNGIIGIDSGVVLSNGFATGVLPTNPHADSSNSLGIPGDIDLANLAGVPLAQTFDATVLEFDFVPQGSTLKFNYVFSSDEYNKFVMDQFNDVFGFFLNGSNVALIPGTNTPVSIHNVNLNTNPQDYINNAPAGDPNPATPPLLATNMDGLTVVLSVTANVNPGVVNHIKLAIADVGDSAFDSNVFIQAGSFSAPLAPVLTAYRPLRYAFRTAEQNEGLSGPTPLSGTAAQPTLDGIITVLNTGTKDAAGPITFEFSNLPQGVSVVNASGVDPNTNLPFITVPVANLPKGGQTPLRFYVKLSDPLDLPLDTFFIGGYDVTGM